MIASVSRRWGSLSGCLRGAAGFAFFGEIPDRWTLLGAAIIVASALYIGRRDAKLARTKLKVPRME